MIPIDQLIRQGAGNVWLFIPSAIALGALHGLEPGHSKTMMAAFIVAVRGTVTQAVLLGLSATASHTAVVWLLAMVGLYLGGHMDAERIEPWFQLLSAVLIVAVALWMGWRTWRDTHPQAARGHHHHGHGHEHSHGHGHGHAHDDHHHHADIGHAHAPAKPALPAQDGPPLDAHARAHAEDIERRFTNRTVTTGQVVLFGLTGGLVPCPASLTVLLLCLQLKQYTLGLGLVLCFSIGLALTLVASGVIAAWGMHHATRRFAGLGDLAHKAPYVSSTLLVLVGLYTGWLGWQGIAALG
jgi:ABC-type nickel/cobalt efflux system permease component RcnA